MRTAILLLACLASHLVASARAGEGPAFPYDRSRTSAYLEQAGDVARVNVAPGGRGAAIRKELSAAVAEILDGPWLPLCSDYSAAQAGGAGPIEWCFNRPGEYLATLSEAAPYLPDSQKTAARELLKEMVDRCPPTRQVYLKIDSGKARNVRAAMSQPNDWLSEPDKQRALFGEGYALWAYARSFDAWDEVRPLFDDLRRLRRELESRDEFTPAYRDGEGALLTAADAKDPAYRFQVYQALLAGFQDNYWYRGALQAQRRMQKDKPVFFYVRTLSALIGYHRLARRYGENDEASWSRRQFERVAAMTVEHRASPYLWSDAYLAPEIGRLIRDAAGPWLDELSQTSNIGNLPATDWNHALVPGRRDYYVMNPHTWYHAWGGQGEGIRPRTVLGAFRAHAYLLNASPRQVEATLDIPWCPADLYYVSKLVTVLHWGEKPGRRTAE